MSENNIVDEMGNNSKVDGFKPVAKSMTNKGSILVKSKNMVLIFFAQSKTLIAIKLNFESSFFYAQT